jgi:hypothetical protein
VTSEPPKGADRGCHEENGGVAGATCRHRLCSCPPLLLESRCKRGRSRLGGRPSARFPQLPRRSGGTIVERRSAPDASIRSLTALAAAAADFVTDNNGSSVCGSERTAMSDDDCDRD